MEITPFTTNTIRSEAELAAVRQAFLADENLARARKAIRDTQANIRDAFGVVYVTISLPQPWGACRVYKDGRVTDPYGRQAFMLTEEVEA